MSSRKHLAGYIILAAGGIIGFIMSSGKKVALFGFALYTIDGIFGCIAHVLTKNYDLINLHRSYVFEIQEAAAHPLITLEYCLAGGLDMPKAMALNLICPAVYLVMIFAVRNSDLYFFDILGHGISCVAMAYYGYTKNEYMAYVTSIMYCVLHFALAEQMYHFNPNYYIMGGLTAIVAGMLLAGKDFSTIFD